MYIFDFLLLVYFLKLEGFCKGGAKILIGDKISYRTQVVIIHEGIFFSGAPRPQNSLVNLKEKKYQHGGRQKVAFKYVEVYSKDVKF